jgi:hypothetical protein
MVSKDWIEQELNNWARWCRSGPEPGPVEPDHCGLQYLQERASEEETDPNKPPPIHVEHAQIVQRVFDSSIKTERKVMQAEYVSPWQYARYSGGIAAAARRLDISTAAYETHLTCIKRRIERAFS